VRREIQALESDVSKQNPLTPDLVAEALEYGVIVENKGVLSVQDRGGLLVNLPIEADERTPYACFINALRLRPLPCVARVLASTVLFLVVARRREQRSHFESPLAFPQVHVRRLTRRFSALRRPMISIGPSAVTRTSR